MKYKIFLATKNRGKIDEFKDIFKKYNNIELLSMLDGYEFHDVIEDKETFEENSQKKALEIAKVVKMFVISDDSGLEVKALDGRPGVYSARYSGENATDETNNKKLLKEMKDKTEREGKYISAITIASPSGKYRTYVGEIKGKILDKEVGNKGFGYDPLFYVEEYKKTFGELDEKLKNNISHRANAMKKLDKEILEFLKAGE
ncbi:XTP/dITP diphosphatase [Haliovirga abyssi]|uniref:dITP/XTP pyrophosphatase n=1 Tax=Haliovirga abyssi TaxID=2996794 RepID=A0AAU9DAI0_9FUSO|nr:XTP/dITP diphosphatase [Haliovirga abyssi]BDU50350.1 hypothetical protein HLVA_09190 [Haliovirga abyssi]